MKRLLMFMVFVCFLVAGTDLFAQGRTDVYADEGALAGYVLPTEDVEEPQPDASRGVCCLNFDNYTGYTIHVWVDGAFRGSVGPWDDGGVCVGSGWTTWYAQTAGGTYSWRGSGSCRGAVNLMLRR